MGVKNELFPLKCIWLLLHCLALPRWQVMMRSKLFALGASYMLVRIHETLTLYLLINSTQLVSKFKINGMI
jgi:hypothetical protein